jgi:hypothetical protein
MGDCNIDHMLDASRRGHVRRHVLLDLVKTGKNTGDGRNLTQEPGAQENCDTPDGRLSSPPVASGRPCRRSRVEPSRLPRHRRCELGSPPSPATEGTCPSPKTSTGRLLTSPSASRARSSQRRQRASASSAHSSALMGTWCHRRSNPSPVFATMLTSLPARALSSLTSRARCATTRRG